MIGLIKLTGVGGQPFYINPLTITLFTPSSPLMCAAMGGTEDLYKKGATIVSINGFPIQVIDSPKDILVALRNLRDQQYQSILNVKKQADQEPWQRGYDEDEEDEDEDLD